MEYGTQGKYMRMKFKIPDCFVEIYFN